MKKLLLMSLLFIGVKAHAGSFPVTIKPFEQVKIASVTVPSLATASWRSDLYGQISATFQNVTSTPVYIGTYPAITNLTNSYLLLPIPNTGAASGGGTSITLPTTDNFTWYFYGMAAANVRIIYAK